MYKISDASKMSGLPTKTIRYYEEIALVTAPFRSDTGYRLYNQQSIDELGFIKRAREFGFSIEECRKLMDLQKNKNRKSEDVRLLTLGRLREIEEKQRNLQRLHDELSHLVQTCHGGDDPNCPILGALG